MPLPHAPNSPNGALRGSVDDVWVVEMEFRPEACVTGLVETEAALVIPLEGTESFFSVGRAAGVDAQLTYAEQITPVVRPSGTIGDIPAQAHYCNNGAAVFGPIVAAYLSSRRQSIWATDLCRLMAGHGSDKGVGWHTYTPFYEILFADRRESVTALFELGLGTNFEDIPSNMGTHGTPGASLRAWRDYFPTARIYGADVDKRILFLEDRIDTFFVDQRLPGTFDALWAAMPTVNLDIFIDDGLHILKAATNTLNRSIGHVKKGGYYIIEDVRRQDFKSYLDLIDKLGLPGLCLDINHAANIYDNCLVVAAVT